MGDTGYIIKHSEIKREDMEFQITTLESKSWAKLIGITLFFNSVWILISAGWGLIFNIVSVGLLVLIRLKKQ